VGLRQLHWHVAKQQTFSKTNCPRLRHSQSALHSGPLAHKRQAKQCQKHQEANILLLLNGGNTLFFHGTKPAHAPGITAVPTSMVASLLLPVLTPKVGSFQGKEQPNPCSEVPAEGCRESPSLQAACRAPGVFTSFDCWAI